MLRKKDSTSFANKFQGIEPVYKLFWRYKETQLGGLGWDKGRFKSVHSYKCNYSIYLASFTLVRYVKVLRVWKLSEFKITGLYVRKAVQRKTVTHQFLIWWKSCIPYCLYWHPSKKFMPKKYFTSKYFLEVLRTNLFSMINHVLLVLTFGLVIIYPWKCWNRITL